MSSLAVSRYLALGFALVLAVMEAVLNSARPGPSWQYAPLWIVDYVIVGALLTGFLLTRRRGHEPVLMVAWALAAGVFYMGLFVGLDPEINRGQPPPATFLGLIAVALVVQVLGLGFAVRAYYMQRSAR
jgi:hypothetical protein